MPMAAMVNPCRRASSTAARLTWSVSFQIVSGSCSTHPFRGQSKASVFCLTDNNSPVSENRIARVLVVPWSMARSAKRGFDVMGFVSIRFLIHIRHQKFDQYRDAERKRADCRDHIMLCCELIAIVNNNVAEKYRNWR